MATVSIYCKNNDSRCEVDYGSTLEDYLRDNAVKMEHPVLGALVNNKVRDLTYRIHKPAIISFFGFYSPYGHDLYTRSLFFLLFKAVHDVLPKEVKLHILHTISGGKYCELTHLDRPIDDSLAQKIRDRMQAIVEADLPFERVEMLTPDAIDKFRSFGLEDKCRLFKNRDRIFTSVYMLGDCVNYYFGYMVRSTGYLKSFGLEAYESGLLLKIPSRKTFRITPTRRLPKLFAVYKLSKDWARQLEVPYVSDLNRLVLEAKDNPKANRLQGTILTAEAFQEKRIMQAADEIKKRGDVKMVLICGPSSSGKTTTCKRLSVQLGVLGYHPVGISVDDFFVEREQTPLDKNGEMDFEDLNAIDLPLFNRTLAELLDGRRVEVPAFDFTQGRKLWTGRHLQLDDRSILVIEGIHCLNPKLTAQVPDDVKYKLFVSALTSISIDCQNPIPTADNRLLRRIVRDYKYRGYSALNTLKRWPSVRAGEERNIFPFQENADFMINTSLIFELGVLKSYAIPILRAVPETAVEYAESARLLKFLSYFESIPDEAISGTSILREFVGGSRFNY